MPPLRRSSAKTSSVNAKVRRDPLEDEARFLKSWLERPLVTGSVTPSGKMLARTMAAYVDPAVSGQVIEIGPGTGPVTEALIRRGVAPERLVLIEFNPDFCTLLRRRFPGVTVVRGDAYDIRGSVGAVMTGPAAATVSSLPLFTKPLEQRLDLLNTAHDLMHPGAPFVQFTYAVVPPIPARCAMGSYTASGSNRVWLNLPPARVWVYRRP
ncbi:Ribosomal RNA small subunit methyltransferase A [Methylobacterium cerastii]|uniref:Ribosomal RNA small subunit methyltransferase A n=1 Tax=Methylobacterium cerastii TaxID=932741 RepID=A0ABQ4QHY4_9HYPH|nr:MULTISPECIES: rRNA adenine N-6-methyltransferase family protein [Methylobacterium]TXM95941.1 phospholipid methyltransferase [Methylobacterium sp. WL122]TXM64928.1 phospholipid methyltransferase [Methylobacterium sp. WL12]TXM68498.1 phospholipid methyltransferase [Methylobacterium sp. WL120]TXM96762.1 phospholipid methyltransferase [Methylobacterium sp. WL103]GJD44480.1 Ribosomal RNA small subunit methyltransferase A [Methylobacterium cerastii]